MARDGDFVAYVQDCMAATGMGPVQNERLFGGHGFRIDGEMFAVILRGTLFFVVDDQSRPRFEAAGMGPFTYARKSETRVVPRWYELPEDVLLDADDLRDWMRDALAAVRRTAKPSAKKTAPKKVAPKKTSPKKAVAKKTITPKNSSKKAAKAPVRKTKARPVR
ncbi:TfoX/Sxy family protein [Ferrovibrio terrae]|uniref:TfoX/Sxy family protein n=1 Tax=Ferrovibrio terrae TaxID=2594003 RepID=UPI003137C515